jgi:hypothetical protein
MLLGLVVLRGRGPAVKEGELLVRWHETAVLRRPVTRPRLEPKDRLLLAAWCRLQPRQLWRNGSSATATSLRWHCELAARQWTYPRVRASAVAPLPAVGASLRRSHPRGAAGPLAECVAGPGTAVTFLRCRCRSMCGRSSRPPPKTRPTRITATRCSRSLRAANELGTADQPTAADVGRWTRCDDRAMLRGNPSSVMLAGTW